MKKLLAALLCLFFSLFTVEKAASQSKQKEFDTLLSTRFSKYAPGAVVLVAKNGKVIYDKAFGMADLELKVPMSTQSVFRIGSNTKQFTAMAILKLSEEGKISLQDDITRFIPDYPTKGKHITIENLLSHTSGIRDYTGLPAFKDIKRKDLTPKELIDLFKNEPLDFEPGQDFRYDNAGFVLLGYIVEKITGQPYGKYISENFFKPLSMKNSYYDDPATIIPNRIPGYKFTEGHYLNADYLSMTLPYAAGSLLTTAHDFLLWYDAVENGKVINSTSVKKAQTSVILPTGKPTGFGFGWAIGNVQGRASVKHVGIVNGFVSYTAYLPAEHIFVGIFSNSEAAGDLDIPASQMAAIVLGKPYIFNEYKLNREALEAYTGIYTINGNEKKLIAQQDDNLVYYSKGGGKSRLIPCGNDLFHVENSLTELKFQRDGNGFLRGYELYNTGLPVKAIATGEQVKPFCSIHLSTDTLAKYTGKYAFNGYTIFEVIRQGEKLYGQMGQEKKEIIPYEKDNFFAKDLDALILFHTDIKGRVTGLTKVQGGNMEAKRIE